LGTVLPNYSGYVAVGFNGYKGSGSDERLIALPMEVDPDNLIPTSVNFLDVVSAYNNNSAFIEQTGFYPITPASFTSIEFYFTLAPDDLDASGTTYSLKESILPVTDGRVGATGATGEPGLRGADGIPYTYRGE
jgi:hypothetical protein